MSLHRSCSLFTHQASRGLLSKNVGAELMALDFAFSATFDAQRRFRTDRSVLVEPLPDHSLAGADLGAETGLGQVVAADVRSDYLHNRNK